MVPATFAPTSTAPKNSQIPARTQAWGIVSDFDDTEVANELWYQFLLAMDAPKPPLRV